MSESSTGVSFETGHEEMIHDAQMDYYGKRIATASSDRSIKIFELQGKNQTLVAELKGHSGPVWQVAWGHPKHGNLLASCSYDRKVCIWQEVQKNNWRKVYEDASHRASVNSVCWAPHEAGRALAAASADGKISVHTFKDNKWSREEFPAHPGGVNSVSWAPAVTPNSLLQQGNPNVLKQIVTGGCDNRVRIWCFNDMKGQWVEKRCLKNDGKVHKAWVRDVAWAPSLGLPGSTIASCSEDKTACIWTENKDGLYEPIKNISCKGKAWRVSWSTMGNILAVSEGSNSVTLWKESVDGKWQNLADMDEGLPNKPEVKASNR
mmetsp:Transcript_17044/g.23850  ORF Transcript_17044/g.23850 Transcript_17044/m.23850 type:complete len:320 (-) Transcript_17044:198-1157(-)|eukprot:CAMPEP_0184479350 /NCGR_PEP_ID=MMETSP0113_2-20130426/1109_1 /TAXON_ID=91329 /ORGANISM="Norrisiella sphaerica, Strain BC52" /LENGTH=319 /DNA_ID=CAMNT_0026857411 /DNA_START=48 /DNA_END=1007 /DNA_ORIENTATION=+